MKQKLLLASIGLCAALPAVAQLNIPGDGSDGAFNPLGTNFVVDLSQAVTGAWDANNAGNAGKGIYDSSKWAIVFKYQSVNIPSNTTVTFINHPSYAPVVWLVQSNVTVDGVVSLNGQNGADGVPALIPAEPGPGGFRGGAFGPSGKGAGMGPGGGQAGNIGSGEYAPTYGNPQIIPLIGGSGGGSYTYGSTGGSGAGGALLIAARESFTLNGMLMSRGGSAAHSGSAGAVRIIASAVMGEGQIDCNFGYPGRIRIETPTLATAIRTFPETIKVAPASPPMIWPPANAPTARIVSVAGTSTPTDPTAPLVNAADVGLTVNGNATVLVETRNFPIEGVVQVRAAAKFGGAIWNTCTLVSGNFAVATWSASVTFPPGFTTLQARATAP